MVAQPLVIPVGVTVASIGGAPMGYEQIPASALNAPTGLSAPAGAICAMISVEGASGSAVRWRDDGVLPTSFLGILLIPGVVAAVCLCG